MGMGHRTRTLSQLVRSGSDARRLLAPIRELADHLEMEEMGEEVNSILLKWDDPSFAGEAWQALKILDELDDVFTSGEGGVDMINLGEIRVPLNALSAAIKRRQQQLTAVGP